MRKKTMKALASINDFLDDRYQKLYDRCHYFELSRNRMARLLKRWHSAFSNALSFELCDDELRNLIIDTHRELYGLESCRLTKVKGGKHA